MNDFSFVWCRDVMTSCHDVTKLFNLSQVMNLLERWSCSGFHGFSGCLFSKCKCSCFCGMISCHNVTSWRHVNTQHKPTALTNLVVESYWDYYTNSKLILGCWYQTNHRYYFASCRQHVTTSRHNATKWRHAIVWNWSNTSMSSIFTGQLTRFTYILFNCSILSS